MTKPPRRRRHGFSKLVLALALMTAVLLLDSNTRLVTDEYELRFNNLPGAFDGYRIAVLSDIHATEFGEGNERLLTMVKDARPDIIAITGDLIDGKPDPGLEAELDIVRALVPGLTKIAPVYYITGNHEWDSGGIRPLLTILGELDVSVLRNRYVKLEKSGDVIILAGTDDPNGPADMIKPPELAERIFDEHGAAFIVMLEHRNNNLELYAQLGVDLVLCGHAHGGIIRLPFTDGLVGPSREWMPTYTSGVYEMGSAKMLVSRGIGNHTGFPRFLNNPQIAVAVLKKA